MIGLFGSGGTTGDVTNNFYGLSQYSSIAALKGATAPEDGTKVVVGGYAANGDGGGGVFFYDEASSADDDGGTIIAPTEGSGRWKRIYSGTLSPEWFGASGDGLADDSAAVQATLDAASNLSASVLFTRWYSVSSVVVRYGHTTITGIGPTCGLKARTAAPVLTSTLSNRDEATSVESLQIKNFAIDGNSVATHGIELERFTRGCSVEGVFVHDVNGSGITLSESWSYSLINNRIKDCAGTGLDMPDVNNAFNVAGNHVTGCDKGCVVENSQGGSITGNTFEYNKTSNLEIAGNATNVSGNYIEGIHSSVTDLGGSAYQVTLGSASVPFKRSTFNNYVNGGSVTEDAFTGDGVKLLNVVESDLSGSFSQSTRYEWVYDEAWTLIGCSIKISFDSDPAAIRNLTAAVTGGVEILTGANCRLNSGMRTGDGYGTRTDYQTSAETGGNISRHRIISSAGVLFDVGKTISTDNIYNFSAPGGGVFAFLSPVKVPVMTSTQRDAITSPKNGMVILNTTTGKYQGYKEATSSWVDFN